MDDGEVYVVGMGDDDWEEPITKTPHQYFSNMKSIDSGHAIAVGSRRKVFLREEAGEWNKLDAGLFPDEENTTLRDAGFQDLDGFGENDMYACGGRSDLWRFDGARWQKIDVPPNMGLKMYVVRAMGLFISQRIAGRFYGDAVRHGRD